MGSGNRVISLSGAAVGPPVVATLTGRAVPGRPAINGLDQAACFGPPRIGLAEGAGVDHAPIDTRVTP
ncbi:hypothetical protein [Sinosporangium siamense]|uniref:Uncharacterized protein n=1 Tax=Sinosporangium siamense TaxID=1367973 RepID=A0A919V9D7_9ACTN|nr:hypothetical protein [Sinosporangium siamense]GII94202.1 hypothetical protein Ssi02_44330 [Sinosporangium siamense]